MSILKDLIQALYDARSADDVLAAVDEAVQSAQGEAAALESLQAVLDEQLQARLAQIERGVRVISNREFTDGLKDYVEDFVVALRSER